jgi:hypothetical protein
VQDGFGVILERAFKRVLLWLKDQENGHQKHQRLQPKSIML